jgi:hypothetical protein
VKRQVGQASVFGAVDAVFGAGAAAVPQFRSGSCPPLVWGEAGDPPRVMVDRPQLRAGVRHFVAGDDANARRPSGQVQQPGYRPRRRRREPEMRLIEFPMPISLSQAKLFSQDWLPGK